MLTGLTTLTRKGQITIPKSVREELGLNPFDTIEVTVENGEARIRKAPLSLDDVAGMFPPPDVPIEDMPRIAKEERAKRLAEKLR